jgi:hypothetical protein
MQFCRGELKDLPRPKGSPLFRALKVISLHLNLRPSFCLINALVFVNEISRNKVVVPEGAAGLIVGFRSFLLVDFSFTLNYYVVRFDLI